MLTSNLTIIAETIEQIESLQSDEIENARKVFRSFLLDQGKLEQGSFGDALAKLAEKKSQHPIVAAILLGCTRFG